MRAALLVALVACGRPAASVDAPPPSDGPCGADVFVTGEIVDWDSGAPGFCGVFDATVSAHDDPSRSDRTSPNGRFELCVAAADTIDLDVAPPTAASPCLATPSTYATPGRLVVARTILDAGGFVSIRMMSVARAADFGHDPARAQVFVHVAGDARRVTLSAAHGSAQRFANGWAAGDTGTDVYFPDVAPADDATVTGGGTIPLAAGAFTYAIVR